MSIHAHNFRDARAVVSRPPQRRDEADLYLRLASAAAPDWTTDPAAATAFDSMRDAMRAALRLPAGLRAFGLPLRTELATHGLH